MKYIILDTETTSLRPGQIAQLTYAIVDFEQNKAFGKNFYFEVDSMDPSAENIHKLSIEDLRTLSKGNRFEDHAHEIFNDFQDATLVCHNTRFDIPYLSKEFSRNAMSIEGIPSICTMKHYKPIVQIPDKRGNPKNPKLEELVNYFNIKEDMVLKTSIKLFGGATAYHDARNDVAATFLVFMKGVREGQMMV